MTGCELAIGDRLQQTQMTDLLQFHPGNESIVLIG